MVSYSRIAVAGNNKRISILDLSTMKPNYIQMQSLISRVQSKVLALAWHPVNENLLSFSTNEGRIGVFDISKSTDPPQIMKNFCGKNVYRLSYGISPVTNKGQLFASNDLNLTVFPEKNSKSNNYGE